MDFIIKHYESAKANILAEKEQKVAVAKEQAKRDVQPKFQEIEQMKSTALQKASADYNSGRNLLTEQYNAQLMALKTQFESEQNAILENAEAKKTEILNVAIQTATYEEEKQCARAITDLDNLIAKIKEKE